MTLCFINIFLQTIKEKATDPKSDDKSETEIVAHEENTGVGAHGNREYFMELQIPPNLELPNFKSCQLFSQSCRLEVSKRKYIIIFYYIYLFLLQLYSFYME